MDYLKYARTRGWQQTLSAPFIYPVIIAFVILDILVEIYHRICFPLYGIPLVDRWKYIKIDRHKLAYLDAVEKLNCMYCGYANGLLNYVTVITAKTEQYWCSIKHQQDPNFIPPEHHKNFIPYGDAAAITHLRNQNSKLKSTE